LSWKPVEKHSAGTQEGTPGSARVFPKKESGKAIKSSDTLNPKYRFWPFLAIHLMENQP
jgi:hypothetical protein